MSFLGKVFGEAVGETVGGLGKAAIDIRSAITGELPPDARTKLEEVAASLDQIRAQSAASVIIAEAQGQSWLQRNWRPMLMLVIIAIVANNYLIYPYATMFSDKFIPLELPTQLWTLMEIGVGGYIVGRSAEKVLAQR